MKVFHLILPYEDELKLELEPQIRGHSLTATESEVRRWLNTELTEEELPRIMACAAALWQECHGFNKQWTKGANEITIWQCIETAIVWERG